MAHIQFVDELVREYLLYRGFTSAVKAFDNDLKADKDKGFRVDKIVEQILHYVNVSDLNGLKEYWSHLDSLVFTKLEIHVQPDSFLIFIVSELQQHNTYITGTATQSLTSLLQGAGLAWVGIGRGKCTIHSKQDVSAGIITPDRIIRIRMVLEHIASVRKLEYSLYKLYLVTAAQSTGGVRNERVTEFFSKMLPELHGQSEWRDWFMLPYVQKPEENPSFSLYFTRAWQDSVLVSLHNLLATVFQCMPQPTLTSYESEAALVKRLQDKLSAAGKNQPAVEKTSPIGHQSRLSQYSERLSGPLPLVDDFCAVPAEQLESGVREAKGLRGLLRQMGGSPVMGRKSGRSQSQN